MLHRDGRSKHLEGARVVGSPHTPPPPPTGGDHPPTRRDFLEMSFAVVLVQRKHRVATLLETLACGAVHDEEVEVTIVVVVEPGGAAAGGVYDVVFGSVTRDIEQRHTCLLCHVDELDRD